jgi:hypothetical protein
VSEKKDDEVGAKKEEEKEREREREREERKNRIDITKEC